MYDMTYTEALSKAAALKEIGQTTIYLDRKCDGLPWSKVSQVSDGSTYRLSGPSSAYMIAVEDGLTFKWSVDFEGPEANGRGTSDFNRDYLREVMRKLPPEARAEFAHLLENKVLPGVKKLTAELRASLNRQADSEDCLRGLIAFAAEPVA